MDSHQSKGLIVYILEFADQICNFDHNNIGYSPENKPIDKKTMYFRFWYQTDQDDSENSGVNERDGFYRYDLTSLHFFFIIFYR
jgi:hypothetical protein